ncbi:MAG: YceI family protein [Gemmatimonadetes bacterium]|nr:YceI family protein [Gemmatimonadota bacterium]MBA4160270.1 YceI family protein [Gemmatimonadota bacterium]
MRVHHLGSLLLLAALAPAIGAQEARELRVAIQPEAGAAIRAEQGAALRIQPSSKVWVEGNSTVRRYKCEAARVSGSVAVDPASSSTAIADLQKAVTGVELSIPVAQLACGDNTMDGHMRKALQAESHPAITFRLTSHEVLPQGTEKGTVKMTGRLNIAGKENVVTVSAEATQEANGGLRVKGSKELKMTEFGVKPPTLMMGTLKVHDPVTVHFDLILRQ